MAPFWLRFAEPPPAEFLEAGSTRDSTAVIAALAGRLGPSGVRDKILLVSHAGDTQVDPVAVELIRRGAPVVRFHPKELPGGGRMTLRFGPGAAQASAFLRLPAADVLADEVKSVWWRTAQLADWPVLHEHAPDVAAFIVREEKAALEGLCALLGHAWWVGQPAAMRNARSKAAQLRLAQQSGFAIPRTLITNDPDEARAFFEECRQQVVLKLFRETTIPLTPGVKQVMPTTRIEPEHLRDLGAVAHAHCFFQEAVEHDAELRVTIFGQRVFVMEIRTAPGCTDYRRAERSAVTYARGAVPPRVEATCLKMLAAQGLAFGAFDLLRRPDGSFVFLEMNADGEWLWVQEKTGYPMVAAMADLLMAGA